MIFKKGSTMFKAACRKIFGLLVFVVIIWACSFAYTTVEKTRQNTKIEDLQSSLSIYKSAYKVNYYAFSIVPDEQKFLLFPAIKKEFPDTSEEDLADSLNITLKKEAEPKETKAE